MSNASCLILEMLTSSQEEYRKKKQTPEERRAARLAKLNPENHKTAKDVMDENERKRKRELEAEDQDASSDNENTEKPGEGMKLPTQKRAKVDKKTQDVQKPSNSSKASTEQQAPAINGEKSEEQKHVERAQKRKEKEAAKKEKIARKEEKRAAKQAAKKASREIQAKEEAQASDHDEAEQGTSMTMMPTDDLDAVDVSGLVDENEDDDKSPSPERDSIFSNTSAQPSASSTSSVETAPAESLDNHPKKIQLPPVDKLELQARLQTKIEALRAARKADGHDGRPARNRAELIEARRKKAEQKKIAKKEARAKARDVDNDDVAKERTEVELARLRGSGSPLGSDIFSPSIPRSPDTNFNFGRVAFTDGQKLDSNLSYFTNPHHAPTKGTTDTKTALAMAQKKQARLNGLDATKRQDIEEKDMWLAAKKKAQGERVVKGDVSLLKKTLKRSNKEKKKSASEWTNRIDGVAKGIEMRQKKREDNLQKRRDERGGGGKKKAAAGKKRPGFEGGFRSKPGK